MRKGASQARTTGSAARPAGEKADTTRARATAHSIAAEDEKEAEKYLKMAYDAESGLVQCSEEFALVTPPQPLLVSR